MAQNNGGSVDLRMWSKLQQRYCCWPASFIHQKILAKMFVTILGGALLVACFTAYFYVAAHLGIRQQQQLILSTLGNANADQLLTTHPQDALTKKASETQHVKRILIWTSYFGAPNVGRSVGYFP